jgi:hypothetical protein
VITINSVDAEGRIDASYANPRPLPFHKAFVTSVGSSLELIFELRAPGYDGSTYTLRYDAATDRLTGVFDQVVARQNSMSFSSAANRDVLMYSEYCHPAAPLD